MKTFNLYMFCGLLFLLTGCISTHDVIPMSQDTYMVRVEDHAGIFAFNRGKMKGVALKKAEEFATSKSMVAIPLGMKDHPVGILGDWPAVEYQFRLVHKNSPSAIGGHLQPRADVVIEYNENIKINQTSINNEDLYKELMKLNDLKKQGILTEEEFLIEKKKLLNH